MSLRYRYRLDPTPARCAILARVFGRCRVVFIDALRIRDDVHRAGVKLSGAAIQRRVITQAKTTDQRDRVSSSGGVLASPPISREARNDESGSSPTAA